MSHALTAAAAALSAIAQDPVAEQPSKSLLYYISAGGVMTYILLVVSVVALALIIVNLVVLRREHLAPLRVIETLERGLKDRQIDQTIAYCRQPENDTFLTRVMAAGLAKLSRSTFGLLELKPALEEAGQRELERLDRPTHALRIIGDLGPMLGLLGTVKGIISAFAAIGGAEGVSKTSQLALSMSEALVHTFAGLCVAIPCTVAAAFFRKRTDRLVAEVADIADRLAALLQPGPVKAPGHVHHHRPAGAPASAPAPAAIPLAPAPIPVPPAPAPPARPMPAGVPTP